MQWIAALLACGLLAVGLACGGDEWRKRGG